MTRITKEEVSKLAELSQIEVSDDEAQSLTQDLQKILEYVDKLSELDTEGVKPTYRVGDLENVWREDEIDKNKIERDELLKVAKENVKNSQIKVPKVL